jgi:hypothetical protein
MGCHGPEKQGDEERDWFFAPSLDLLSTPESLCSSEGTEMRRALV